MTVGTSIVGVAASERTFISKGPRYVGLYSTLVYLIDKLSDTLVLCTCAVAIAPSKLSKALKNIVKNTHTDAI